MRDAKPKLTAEAISEVFEAVLPEVALLGIIRKAKFQERTRKRDALAFIRAMVIAASTGYGGRQRDVARLYFESGAQPVVRGAFYAWFDAELEIAMNAVARRAIEYAASLPLDVPPLLAEHGRDWHIVDSSTVKLPINLFDTFPGTGDYAALKVHKRISVGHGTVVDYHISPAREHDALHFKLDETWRGLGLLADLGYASLKLLRDCKTFDTAFVIRLKDNWKPRIDRSHDLLQRD
jgi:hypothetical protein